MINSLDQILVKILSETFREKISEDEVLALIHVLYWYTLHLSEESLLPNGPVELTMRAASDIVAKLISVQYGSKEHYTRWLKNYHRGYQEKYRTPEFHEVIKKVKEKITFHPWVISLTED